ncbi:MAG: hypothetical protein GTO03_16950 [Planctomycetales bacterium]|nr:hypothetical protein [Planctomycetales bacterium]
MQATIEDYRWLVGREAASWLAETGQADCHPLKALDLLRRDLPPQRAALVVEQLQLRRRAAGKFPAAAQMFFTPLGLQQASGQVVASHKAQRFRGATRVVDLCCGIGGDLLSLAPSADLATPRPHVRGVDRDPVALLLAQANLRALNRDACLQSGDVGQVDLSAGDRWHIDPDRRKQGRRTTTLEIFEPDLAALDALLKTNENAAIKLAPATTAPDPWLNAAELEWISWRQECRQQVAWFGGLARWEGKRCAGLRRATWLSGDGGQHSSISGLPHAPHPLVQRPARFVFDIDPAVRAAHLTGAVATHFRLAGLGTRGAYLTGDQPLLDGLLACFEVLEVLPFDFRRLKRLLKTHRIGQLEVKKRAVPLDAFAAAHRLPTPGDRKATLLLTRLENHVAAILARRQDGLASSGSG